MTSEDELAYLQPGFDPASLTVPKLRNLLLEHNVNYPSSAKKTQLIELFNQSIAPKAKRILAQRARTKPSAKGIVDVPSSQASVADEEEDLPEELPPPPTEKPKRTSRRTTRHTTEESDTALLAPPSGPSRRTSHKHARSSEVETDERPTSRRQTRRTTATPVPEVKEESAEPEAWHRQDNESPFTQDNPFQSGSSPPAPMNRAASHDRRRRTLGPIEQKEKRKSGAARRKTDYTKVEQQDDGIVPPTSSTFEAPVARLRKLKKEEKENGDLAEAGEEFTPEEQEELALERAKHGEDKGVVVRRRQPKRTSGAWWTLPMVVLTAVASGIFYVWREEKLDVGYCGVGRPATSLGGVELPEQFQFLLPQCEPCPQHAYCYPKLRTECEPGFIVVPHPLTADGLLPLPLVPTCEPDTAKAKKIKHVADRAVEELRIRNAQFECGELKDSEGKPASSAEMSEESLRETLLTPRVRKSMTQEEFDALWKEAIGEILGREEVTTGIDG
jgi:Man1-Src1p-C-terminal domain/HeH/LEM domain